MWTWRQAQQQYQQQQQRQVAKGPLMVSCKAHSSVVKFWRKPAQGLWPSKTLALNPWALQETAHCSSKLQQQQVVAVVSLYRCCLVRLRLQQQGWVGVPVLQLLLQQEGLVAAYLAVQQILREALKEGLQDI
jgi:hypothetical protein